MVGLACKMQIYSHITNKQQMIRKKKQRNGPMIIDLTGPDGNAFSLLGTAKNLAKQIGYSPKETHDLLRDMQLGDYENLINVFDKHFGELVILER